MYNYPIYVYKYTQINTKSQYLDTQMNTKKSMFRYTNEYK